MATSASRGKLVQDKLLAHIRNFQRGPITTDRERHVIWGVEPNGKLTHGTTLDNFVEQALRILIQSGRVYRWEDSLVYEFHAPSNQHLQILATRTGPAPHADSILSNLFVAGKRTDDTASQSVVPAKLVNALLTDEDLWHRVPVIQAYARRALFDENFDLRGPGWHPNQGILVHGPDIIPANLPPVAPQARSVDRLPIHLKRIFQDFCWASDADSENALALLLTGLLNNHFVSKPKPIGLIDGNQPEIGKTLLCQVIGQILDGREPERIPLAKEEELEKKIGAKLRESRSSLFFFDNVKKTFESAFIEANAHSPVISVRLLGHSIDISRPNTFLWLVTMNLTRGSSDAITRWIPIRLYYDGNPGERAFALNLTEYASQHRLEILGELAGMVRRWILAGKPNAKDIWPAGRRLPQFRCREWVQIIGGILATNGFIHFLANLEEAKAAMDEGLQALASLAEHAITQNLQPLLNSNAAASDRGCLPREWTPIFRAANVFTDKLEAMPLKGRDTWVGTFLSGKTDRAVNITIGNNSGTAVLRRNPVRNKQNRYYFEIAISATSPVSESSVAANPVEAPSSAGSPAPPPSPTAGGDGAQAATDVPVPAANGDADPVEWV